MPPRKQRVLGLTRHATRPLLKTIGQQPRDGPARKRCRTPEDINAPPGDSDAESSEGASEDNMNSSFQKEKAAGSRGEREDVSQSDTDSTPRGDIRATAFRSGKAAKATLTSQSRGTSRAPLGKRNTNKVGTESRGIKRDADDLDDPDDIDDPRPVNASASRRDNGNRSSPGPSSRESVSVSDHHTNAFNLPNVKQASRKYGKKAPKPSRSRPQVSEENHAPSQTSKPASFQVPVDLPPSSPVAKPAGSGASKRPGIRIPSDLPGSDSESVGAKPKASLNIPIDMPEEPTGKGSRTGVTTKLKRSGIDTKLPEVSSKRLETALSNPALEIPADLPGVLGLDSPWRDEPLEGRRQTPPDFTLGTVHGSTTTPVRISSAKEAPARCPMCSQPVDAALLRSFTRGGHLNINRQLQFCRLHKKKTAEATWEEQGYPTIDWDALASRCCRHDKFLRRIVNGGDSHYRSLLAARVSKGQERTIRKTERSLAPGYYGPRGMRAMSEHLVGRFAATLRRRAVEDSIVSARGTAVFVSTVLVPELAVRLIMEDMHVDPEGARSILEASVDVGELLNEELLDTVQDPISDKDKDAEDADVFV
ncbi:hypothetical protein SODALDRAFT_60570 [Sodiomyces alkalinus F11]|uniref:Restriction of telomere capping protein 4 n=1 Tax=Sodiomyces alkalinus (strain CBS 110278 / VKM F-3762 / F11) TaxID=1314773 RepID=A0A3N2PL90_SODAK|nr:hypothetical protein SODALDRAFT_60570 [Sodiomyces alkalinus F11]ROT35282.1 hypothetical protein SODALDRAFT_60570 [Sodiomyces alkalinus F11]